MTSTASFTSENCTICSPNINEMHSKSILFHLLIFLATTFISVSFEVRSVVPPSNFFFDVDGISVAQSTTHACVLEVKHGTEVGGKAVCWGNDDHGRLDAPSDVCQLCAHKHLNLHLIFSLTTPENFRSNSFGLSFYVWVNIGSIRALLGLHE